MNTNWTAKTLFPETASVTIQMSMGFDQEAENLGCWIQVTKKPSGYPLAEKIGWYNYTPNGLAQCLDALLEIVRETEEVHGMSVGTLGVDRNSAPF